MTRPSEATSVAITFDDGTVGIMQFVMREYAKDGTTRWARAATQETVDEEISRCSFDRAVVSWRFMDRSELPEGDDRRFRAAWKDDGIKLVVDMPKAREIHRDYLREMRKPKLADLDVAYLQVLESGVPDGTAIVAQKQALRDVTDDPAIEAATTPEELKAVIPDALGD